MPEASVMVPCAQNIHVCVLPLQVFGRVVDPENFADQAYLTMNAWQIELADSRIGCLRLFSPDNPTGRKFTSYQFTVRVRLTHMPCIRDCPVAFRLLLA